MNTMKKSKKCVYVFAFLLVPTLVYIYIYSANNFNKTVSYGESLVYESNPMDEHQQNYDKCEVVHIGIVCTGYKYVINLHTMLKSIYFHRSRPIHFHIMVNEESQRSLKILFETWVVPHVEVNYYNIKDYIPSIQWIRNKHYSGIYGLLKLMFPKAISTTVTSKVIILDTDLTFLGDIYNLWNLFNNFNMEQVIGLVEQQTDYYLGTIYKKRPWPAVRRGFNTGVMLYDIKRLQTIGWDSLWTNVARDTLPKFKATDLADQDIINTVIKKKLHLVYYLPCQWNIQLADNTNSSKCYNSNKAQILHWNSPKKINVINEDGTSFRAINKMFSEYNGDMLRFQTLYCLNATNTSVDIPKKDACYRFNEAIDLQLRTLVYFREFQYKPEIDDVTFVSQLSFDKLHIVEKLSKVWQGPISLTVYLTDSELQRCIEFVEKSQLLKKRLNIAYHAVFKRGNYYMMNYLRNISLQNVVTPYVFLVDLDLLPPKDLYPKLKQSLSLMPTMYKKALIVAAFETRNTFPQTKPQLLDMLRKRKVYPFHFVDGHPKAYGPTNYKKWKTAIEPYKVNWQMHFEPYVVVQRNVTGYDKRFVSFGFNKCAHIMELEAQGYEFVVLPNAYVVHKAHPPSKGARENKKSKQYRKCLHQRMYAFIDDLNRKYNRTFTWRAPKV